MTLIAIYHLSIKIITRGEGKSAVAAAAYRSGESLKNEYDGVSHDYTKKGGVVHTEILLPENAPTEYADRSTLWNAVEKCERYKTAQLAREIEIALPVELPREQQISLARRYVSDTFVRAGMCADICIHDTDKGNPHAHIMLTMRPIEKDGSWGQKSHTIDGRKVNTVDWNDRDKAEVWRRVWAAYANGALRIAGLLTEENLLDHRSYERQGIDQQPTVHMGAAATQMERRGIRTERGDINRAIEISNAELRQTKARIKKLQAWLEQEAKAEPPTFFDIISGLLDGGENKTHSQKLIDLKAAAKVKLFMEQNHLATIVDVRDKVMDFYGEQQEMGERLNKIDRRLKTLDEHAKQTDSYKRYRGYKVQYEKLYAVYQTAQKSTGLFAKGKAQKALDEANAYHQSHVVEIGQFETAEKYLRGVLQGRFDPKNFPIAKWKDEQAKLKAERGGLNRQYAVLREKVKEVEVIRKHAEDAHRALNPPQKSRAREIEF